MYRKSIKKDRLPENGKRFQGGNLKGIRRRLDYIADMGVNAIWLSPVFKNRVELDGTYHGYGIQDFLEVDPRFGTKEELRELVNDAHYRGMYVILDIIINHTGDNWAYPDDQEYQFWPQAPGPFDFGFWRQADPDEKIQEDDAVWPVELQHPDCYRRRGRIRDFTAASQDEAIMGDFASLKELDITRPQVLDTLIKIYKYWIATTDVDGFRIDTVKHMESSATAIFCNAVREYAKSIGKHNFFIFGEVVGDDSTIHQYLGRNSRIPGTNERFPSLDAALDFPLYFILEEVIKGFLSPELLRRRYDDFKSMYSDHGEAGRYFVTFVDNHDQMTRPYRRFLHQDPFPAQVILAIGYLLTSQGIPCIYYGSEQEFDGGGDHDSYVRETMFGNLWGAFETTGHHFFNRGNKIYKHISEVAKIRQQEPVLRYGRQYFRETSADGIFFAYPDTGKCIMAFSRILDDTELLVALNLDTEPRTEFVTVDANITPAGARMADLLLSGDVVNVQNMGERNAVQLKMQGHSFSIFKLVPRETA